MSGKVHDMEVRLGLGYKKHHHANSTTFLHAFLLLSLLHTMEWAGSAGEGKGHIPDLLHYLFVQPNTTNGTSKDKSSEYSDKLPDLLQVNLNSFMLL